MIAYSASNDNSIAPSSRSVRVPRRKNGPSVLAGRMTRDSAGSRFEQSILLPLFRAQAFAAALRARADIEAADVVRSHRVRAGQEREVCSDCAGTRRQDGRRCASCRGRGWVDATPRFYVRFLRASVPLSLSVERRRMQDIRAQRAADQGGEMEFWPREGRDGWYWCVHHYPDSPLCGVYEVSVVEGCTCPDWQFRCSWQGLRDKHQLALAASLAPKPVVVNGRGETREQRKARLMREKALDF